MCKVSDKIKFCICSAADASSHKHYWVLHRFVEGKDVMLFGEIMPAYGIDPDINKYNKALLRKRVNEKDAFDMDLQPGEDDRLEIIFKCKDRRISYGFKFHNGKWVSKKHRPFELERHHEESIVGKIESPLISNK